MILKCFLICDQCVVARRKKSWHEQLLTSRYVFLFYLSARALSEWRSSDWLILRQAVEVPVWFSNLEALLDDIHGRNNCKFYVKKITWESLRL